MSRSQQRPSDPLAQARTDLHARLQGRRPEIEQEILSRVHALSESIKTLNPEYTEGLRAAVSVALDFGLAAIKLGEDRAPPIPVALLAQARVAARSGISLPTVQSRYIAGNTLLSDFLIREAEEANLVGNTVLTRLMRTQFILFERLLAAVREEYAREEEKRRPQTPEQRRAEYVQRLLDGEQLDTSNLPHDFDATHLGIVAVGPRSVDTLRDLARDLNRRLWLVRQTEQTVWAWLSGHHRIDPADVMRIVPRASWPRTDSLAMGEPADGLSGWRLTHRQARAALPIALQRPGSLVRYADVAVLASILQDDLLTVSLRQLYLDPIIEGEGTGVPLRETLLAYFAADRNISSASSALGASRQAVGNRLRTIEERLGRTIGACSVELEVALQLDNTEIAANAPGRV